MNAQQKEKLRTFYERAGMSFGNEKNVHTVKKTIDVFDNTTNPLTRLLLAVETLNKCMNDFQIFHSRFEEIAICVVEQHKAESLYKQIPDSPKTAKEMRLAFDKARKKGPITATENEYRELNEALSNAKKCLSDAEYMRRDLLEIIIPDALSYIEGIRDEAKNCISMHQNKLFISEHRLGIIKTERD